MNMQNECAYAKKQEQKENKRKKCMSMTISQLWGFLYMHCLEKKNFSPLAAILKDIAKTAAFQQQTKSRKIGFK